MADDIPTNKRVDADRAAEIRETRSAEAYLLYDTVVIGRGAAQRDPGWFNTWADFSQATDITWHTRRNPNVGQSYTNRPNERNDYAYDIFMVGVEFFVPGIISPFMNDLTDITVMQRLFGTEVAHSMAFELIIGETDQILLAPAQQIPAGAGQTGFFSDNWPQGVQSPPQNGEACFRNKFSFPEPIMVPAQGSLNVRSRVNDPVKSYLATLQACPGDYTFPTCDTDPDGLEFYNMPVYYRIQVSMLVVRYLQLRGGRSAR